MTPKILTEIERVLAYPKILKQLKRFELEIDDVLAFLLQHVMIFEDVDLMHVVKDDPTDDIFINAAIVANASYLVTGDSHLLKIGHINQIQIVKIRTFLEQ